MYIDIPMRVICKCKCTSTSLFHVQVRADMHAHLHIIIWAFFQVMSPFRVHFKCSSDKNGQPNYKILQKMQYVVLRATPYQTSKKITSKVMIPLSSWSNVENTQCEYELMLAGKQSNHLINQFRKPKRKICTGMKTQFLLVRLVIYINNMQQ